MKARITLLATILLATAFTFACGYIDPKCKPNVDCVGIIKYFKEVADEKDSVKCYADSLRIANHIINKVNDSLNQVLRQNITAKTMINSGEFYSKAFNELQSSVMIFLASIAIVITLFTGGSFLTIKLYYSKNNRTISYLKREIESQKKYLDSNKNVLFDEIGNMYFSLAIAYFKQEEWSLHFDTLSKYYEFLITYKIDIQEKELNNLIALHNYTKLYIDKIEIAIIDSIFQLHLRDYFGRLSQFKQYCEETNKQKHLEVVKRMYYSFEKFIDVINRRLAAKGAFI